MEQNYATSFLLQAQNNVGPLGRWAVGPLGRWAVGPLGRWAVGPLMLGALCTIQSVAQAQTPEKLTDSDEANGYWTVSSKWNNGSTSGIIGKTGEDDPQTDTYSWDYTTRKYTDEPDPAVNGPDIYGGLIMPYSMRYNTYGRVLAGSTSYGTQAKVKAEGMIEFTYNWVPRVAGDKPTKDLHLFLRSSADASAYNPLNGSDASVKGKAWAWVSADPTEGATTGQQTVNIPSKSARGGKLITIKKEELSATRYFSIGAGADTPGLPDGQQVDTIADISAWTQVDDRSVTLSRAGAINEWTDYDGAVKVTHGDTIYTIYHEYFNPSFVTTSPSDLSFSASYNGNWSWDGSTDWVISDESAFLHPGTGDLKGTYTLRRTAVLGSQGKTQSMSDNTMHWVGNTGSRTVTIKYLARDNSDSAELEEQYVLTIHDPIEKKYEVLQVQWVYTPVWGSSVHGGDPNGVQKEWGPFTSGGQNNPSVDVGHGSSHGTAETVSGEVGFEEVGLAFGYSKEWSNEQSSDISQSVPINIDVPQDSFTYPQFEDEYARHYVFFRHFTSAGEHKLTGSTPPSDASFYDPELHECIFDEPKGGRVMWAPPQRETAGHIPSYGDPIEPTTHRSGGSS